MLSLLLNILLALRLAPAPLPPLFAVEPCSVSAQGGSAASGDVRDALAACAAARARFAALFGDPVAPVAIVLRAEPGYRVRLEAGGVAVLWPDGAVLAAAAAGGGGDPAAAARQVRSQLQDQLPHEVVHGLLAARFYPDGFVAAPGSYGTPLPDWLEEALAIWAESESNRTGRLAQARRLPAARRELPAILAAPHPGLASAPAMASRDGGPLPDDEALWAFYPQSFAVLMFVHERGGAAAVQVLTARLVADPSSTDALAGLPDMPPTMEEVVRAWRHWLDQR
jgi:hypothetical protein